MTSPETHQLNTRKKIEELHDKKRVALLFHIKIIDIKKYTTWLEHSDPSADGKRLFRVTIDPAAREGMTMDELLIHEFSSGQAALAFMDSFSDALSAACSELTILAITPELDATFWIVKALSWIYQRLFGVKDKCIPDATWRADNTAVWPDDNQMNVARKQPLDEPVFVYNLNKNKPLAEYPEPFTNEEQISGQQAYNRYAKVAGFELLRRGAFPVYGGEPIGLLLGNEHSMLSDGWDKFIFVRYPQRRTLLNIIESDSFKMGQNHRNAGLQRVAIFMGKEAVN